MWQLKTSSLQSYSSKLQLTIWMTSDKTSSKFAQKYISTRTIILVEFFMMKSNSQAYACMQFCKDSHFLTCCIYCVYTSQHVAPDYLFQRMRVEFLNSIFLYSYAFIPIHMFAHVTNRTVACCCNCVVSFFFLSTSLPF